MTASERKLISAEHVFVDSIHVKTRKHEPIKDALKKGRENNGKVPPDKFDKEETKEIKERTADSGRGYYVKDERTKQFAYLFYAAAGLNSFVLGTIVTGKYA
ncbi:hypothetical protein [Peribacillus simplex]|uniref:hypothetical protein n=1 Tax=Peribacillus simplex TaxID=1478 RepID=UPI003D27154B